MLLRRLEMHTIHMLGGAHLAVGSTVVTNKSVN